MALVGCALLAGAAHGQTTRQGGDQIARMQAVVQQLASERATLQAEKTKLEARVAELEGKVKASEDKEKTFTADLARSQAAEQAAAHDREALNARVEQARSRTDELVARFRETATTLQQTERERGELQQQLASSTSELETCSQRNVSLYEVGIEVLDRYESKGFWSVMRQKEPFTQLKRVEIENLADEYRQRLDDGRYAGKDDGA
jgi:chromosome segregation ATPase